MRTRVPARLTCFLALLLSVALFPLCITGASGDHSHHQHHHLHHQPASIRIANHGRRQSLNVEWKDSISKRELVAQTDYEGDYASIANTAAAPPPLKRRRSLLQDYGPVHNQDSSSKPHRRKLL